MNRKLVSLLLVLVLIIAGAVAWLGQRRRAGQEQDAIVVERSPERRERDRLFRELQPVRLANCELARFGEANDGGYLLCANLLASVRSAYSYGISGYDGWGCTVSSRLKVRTHQYDCFDLKRPACPGGDTLFHPECIGPEPSTDTGGRPFDTLANQIKKNGDAGQHLVLKMDVEGAEWDSLLHTPDAVLAQIDQLVIELHDFDRDTKRYIAAVMLLKNYFHVAHLHFNNYSCMPGLEPFPAQAYEVLFVSKRLATLAGPGVVARPLALDAPNNPALPDCQFIQK